MSDATNPESALLAAHCLDDLDHLEPLWLEAKRGFERYSLDGELSFWACGDCGSVEDIDPDEGCQHCGYMTEAEECAA
jgi:hypothetical protein